MTKPLKIMPSFVLKKLSQSSRLLMPKQLLKQVLRLSLSLDFFLAQCQACFFARKQYAAKKA